MKKAVCGYAAALVFLLGACGKSDGDTKETPVGHVASGVLPETHSLKIYNWLGYTNTTATMRWKVKC